jgi:PKD domain
MLGGEKVTMGWVLRRAGGTAVRVGALVIALGFGGASAALAATRYATPTGAGTACTAPGTSPGPCTVQTAVNSAAVGDQVVIEPGQYGSAGSPMTSPVNALAAGVTITAGPGGTPQLFFGGGAGLILQNTNQSVSGLDVTADNVSIFDGGLSMFSSGDSGDRMYVHVTNSPTACEIAEGTLMDSVCWNDASSNGHAVLAEDPGVASFDATLRNVTAIATGSGGVGILAWQENGSPYTSTISAVNVIARGGTGTGAADVAAYTSNSGSLATVNIGYSDYATTDTTSHAGGTNTITATPQGSNQTAPPAFVNAEAGDFHELPTSTATIDKGFNDGSLGPLDLDGFPRIAGSAPDIGAYERQTITARASATPSNVATGAPTTFSATASSSIPGDTLSYAWSFDDGTIATGPSVSHAFATVGTHTGSVTVSDSSGSSATATASVVVMPPTVVISNAHESHHKFRAGNKLARVSKSRRPPVGTTFSFSLNQAAGVKFKFTERVPGRRSKGKCVPQTNRNRTKPACKRIITAGVLSFTGHAGINKVIFQGRVTATRKLRPGTYVLVITARGPIGQKSNRQTLTFTLVR